jgi:Na+/melibiose symporter-like transporter
MGVIIPSALLIIFFPSTEEYPIGQLNPQGYIYVSIVTSAICLVFGLLCCLFTIKKSSNKNVSRLKLKDVWGNFVSIFKNRKLSKIIWGYFLTSVATVFLCSVGLHFFTYSFFYSSIQITVLLLTLIVGNIISQPFWLKISRLIRKKPALILGFLITIFSVFGIIMLYFFRVQLFEISYYINMLLMIICGFGSGALYTLTVSIYGDAIDEVSRGDNASYLGALTFAGNIANSLSQLLIGVLLDVIGFDSSVSIQSLSVQSGLALILFVGVQTFLIVGCLIFSGYKEKGEKNI